jgi:signal transduction histidine kinase/PleD family two-component response regulator
MTPRETHIPDGRVLIVGGRTTSSQVAKSLSDEGFDARVVTAADQLSSAVEELHPEAVLFTSSNPECEKILDLIRKDSSLKELPLLGDVSRAKGSALRQLDLDDFVQSAHEVSVRLEAMVRARRLAEREAASRRRLEALLEITQAASSSLELDTILAIAVEKIAPVLSAERCSVVLVEGNGPRTATVVASKEGFRASPIKLDLIKYPELRSALHTRQAVYIEDIGKDPLLAEVRSQLAQTDVKSILVQPLVSGEDVLGALFLRVCRSSHGFGREEKEFAQTVASALANSVRNAQLHGDLKRKRDELESAYVDRYRELSEANRRLKELNRVKDEIIAVCSHDLRAPLQVLLGHGRILLETDIDPEQKASAEAMVRQGKKILTLVESLLERGKGEQARVSIEPARVDLAELCKELSADLSILAQQKDVTVKSETPQSLMVLGDEVKIREVIQNLITNAIDHSKAGGVVRVYSQSLKRPDGDVAKVVVKDEGPGLPLQELHLVFDRYRHGPGGVGLGLAICKEFIELHGGEIWAERPPEGGTAFVFTLPLSQKPVVKAEPVPELGEVLEQPRVLVVEDEPEVAAVLAEILRSRYRVEVARDGAEGLAKAKALSPDLVVMDVFLPKLDGLDAAVALKSSSDTADIPVILLSAHRGVAEKVRALNLGAVDYMSKPFQAMDLLGRSERALKLRHAERELKRSLALLRKSGSDPHSGLLDRFGFINRLEQEVARSRRYRRPLSVVSLVPRSLPGDRVRAVAAFVRQSLRLPDVVGHLGDGVFGVILTECDPERARVVFQRLLPEIAQATGVRFIFSSTDALLHEGGAESLLDCVVRSAKEFTA